jgi:hypothetical protein
MGKINVEENIIINSVVYNRGFIMSGLFLS